MKQLYTYCQENGEIIGLLEFEQQPQFSTTKICTENFIKPMLNFELDEFYDGATESEIRMATVPNEVQLWKIRAVLANMGLEQNVVDAINNLPNPPKTEALYIWNYGTAIDRDSQTIGFIQLILQLTDEQVDQIFINANNIQL